MASVRARAVAAVEGEGLAPEHEADVPDVTGVGAVRLPVVV